MNGDYIIKFTSLKDGYHDFNYKIGNKFFEHIEYSEIKEAEIVVNLSLEKKSTMIKNLFTTKVFFHTSTIIGIQIHEYL